ncbi:hypothetical protein D1BOALGB6SA_10523 [Olavius sp. associated proteobacterium Delta 1]|nr:hypothetical protein D1BOALGB6SA_10523 [Olavius sp. associated proteobacterium Delta 1]
MLMFMISTSEEDKIFIDIHSFLIYLSYLGIFSCLGNIW